MADKSSQRTRSASQIEADMNATRQRLTASVETLIDQVHPNRVKQRGKAKLNALIAEYKEKAKGLVFNARGDLRKDRLAKVGGGAASLTTLMVVLRLVRSRLRRRRQA